MGLSDVATLASIVSSAAVAISLIYVALQVRQAEKNQRALMQQGRADRAWEGSFRVADPVMSVVFHKGLRRPEELSADELDQFLSICRAAFLSGEDSFLQHRSGLLDGTAYASFVAGVRGYIAGSPGLRAAWRLTSHQFGAEYVGFMDSLVAATPRAAHTDQMVQWRQIIQSDGLG
ncbi:MAG: hypothetical protein ACHP7N_12795 [Caulobacterales bacterium]